MMEWWSDGFEIQYSNTPVLHYSNTPIWLGISLPGYFTEPPVGLRSA
jgi:hypothetical protein